jgi:excisionase family DNA binding protein
MAIKPLSPSGPRNRSTSAHRAGGLTCNYDDLIAIDFDRLKSSDAVHEPPPTQNPPTTSALHLHPTGREQPPSSAVNTGTDLPATGYQPSVSEDGQPDTIFRPPFLSIGNAANWLNVSLATMKRLLQRRDIPCVRIGNRRKIPLAVLQQYTIEQQANRDRPHPRKPEEYPGSSENYQKHPPI